MVAEPQHPAGDKGLDSGAGRRNMHMQLEEEVPSMCHERFLRRRRREVEESRELWEDFERTRPVGDPEPPAEVSEAERGDARREEITTPER